MPWRYSLASPIEHVRPHCPATLVLQGAHDQIVPLESVHRTIAALRRAGVPTVYVEYPRTAHAFDLVMPPLLAPAGQSALYDLERFLACAVSNPATQVSRTTPAGTSTRAGVEVPSLGIQPLEEGGDGSDGRCV
jgi:hypothetical protein